jgi:hypothetical protein
MHARILTAVAGAAMLLSGCPKPDSTVATPSPATSTKCLVPTTSESKCESGSSGGNDICRFTAFASDGNAVVFPYTLNVGQFGPDRAVTIIWELQGAGEMFVAASGDGPIQLMTDPRFSNAWVSNRPDGSASAPVGKYFRIDFANAAATPASGIAHELQFTDRANNRIKCDPNIINTGG